MGAHEKSCWKVLTINTVTGAISVTWSGFSSGQTEVCWTLVKTMGRTIWAMEVSTFPLILYRLCLPGVINDDNCPVCGSNRIRRIRRITGYFSSTDRFNDAKLAELRDRVTTCRKSELGE